MLTAPTHWNSLYVIEIVFIEGFVPEAEPKSSLANHRWPELDEIWPSALLRNVQNIRICMGEKTIVSVDYECKRI